LKVGLIMMALALALVIAAVVSATLHIAFRAALGPDGM
jgi:hypothetical protein